MERLLDCPPIILGSEHSARTLAADQDRFVRFLSSVKELAQVRAGFGRSNLQHGTPPPACPPVLSLARTHATPTTHSRHQKRRARAGSISRRLREARSNAPRSCRQGDRVPLRHDKAVESARVRPVRIGNPEVDTVEGETRGRRSRRGRRRQDRARHRVNAVERRSMRHPQRAIRPCEPNRSDRHDAPRPD